MFFITIIRGGANFLENSRSLKIEPIQYLKKCFLWTIVLGFPGQTNLKTHEACRIYEKKSKPLDPSVHCTVYSLLYVHRVIVLITGGCSLSKWARYLLLMVFCNANFYHINPVSLAPPPPTQTRRVDAFFKGPFTWDSYFVRV